MNILHAFIFLIIPHDFVFENHYDASGSHLTLPYSVCTYTREWQKQVRKFQVPIFALNAKGAWTLRFDDILADAPEAGPFRVEEYPLQEDIAERLKQTDLNEVYDIHFFSIYHNSISLNFCYDRCFNIVNIVFWEHYVLENRENRDIIF